MASEVNIAKIILKNADNQSISSQFQFSYSKLVICDELMTPFLEKANWNEITTCSINLGVTNVAISIESYTLTDKIYFGNFYNHPSFISIFQSKGTNVHIVNQSIENMQLDCQKILLASCNIQQLDIGLAEHSNILRKARETKDDFSGLTAYKMKNIDLRDCKIKTTALYVECDYFNIQGCHIDNLHIQGGFAGKITALMKKIHIWQYTEVRNMELHCKVNELKIEESNISNLVAKAYCLIETLKVHDSKIYNAHNFEKKHIRQINYDGWLLIERSAGHDRNLVLKAEANYQLAKINSGNEIGFNKFFSKIFGFCTGYGFKPIRALGASMTVIILVAILFTVLDAINAIQNNLNIFTSQTVVKGFGQLLNNVLLSFSAFAGQSDMSKENGLVFWISTVEYITGIVIFAMFVNALYVRYKN